MLSTELLVLEETLLRILLYFDLDVMAGEEWVEEWEELGASFIRAREELLMERFLDRGDPFAEEEGEGWEAWLTSRLIEECDSAEVSESHDTMLSLG